MKKLIAIALAVGVLIGVGALLLPKREAAPEPDVEKSEPPHTAENTTAPEAAAPSAAPATHDGHGHEEKTHETAEAPRGVDPLQGKRLSAQEFRALAASVAKALPTKKSVQGLSDKDVHTTPKPMMEAGQQLGLIAQAVSNEPSLAGDAFVFYGKCAASGSFLDAVRALCFSNYKQLGAKLGKPVREESVPVKIRELAEKIQGL